MVIVTHFCRPDNARGVKICVTPFVTHALPAAARIAALS